MKDFVFDLQRFVNIHNTTESHISGTDYNDYIWNESVGSYISTGKGDDNVNNGVASAVIHLGEGNDTAWSNDVATNVRTYGEEGNDNLGADGDGAYLDGGDGDDYCGSCGNNVTICMGDGNDSGNACGTNVFIDCGDGNDRAGHWGSHTTGDTVLPIPTASLGAVTIDGGKGNDFLDNWHTVKVTLLGGDDNDTIENNGRWFPEPANHQAGTYPDSVENFASTYCSLDGGSGNDSIRNDHAPHVTVNGGDGDDTIEIDHSDDVSVHAGDGDDVILNKWVYYDNGISNTINGGVGNDLIVISEQEPDSVNGEYIYSPWDPQATVIEYEANDSYVSPHGGQDTIVGFNENDTLVIRHGRPRKTIQSGNDVILIMDSKGERTVTLKDVAGRDIHVTHPDVAVVETLIKTVAKISLTAGNDNYINGFDEKATSYPRKNAIIYGLAGDDTINNYGGEDYPQNNVTIDGGTGKDLLINGAKQVSLFGGTGNDTIDNMGDNSTVNGGIGNDVVQNTGIGSKIDTGADNDYVMNDANAENAQITTGKGNDTVWSQGYNTVINTGDGNDEVRLEHQLWEMRTDGKDGTNVTVNTGTGNDLIQLWGGENVTITSGTGKDTLEIRWLDNFTVTDFDTNDVLNIRSIPNYARFKNKVLTIGNININLPKVTNISKYRSMKVKFSYVTFDGKPFETTLGALLDAQDTFWWKIDGTTATYLYVDKPITKITGLKKGTTANDFSLDSDTSVVTVSKNALTSTQVKITGDYTLALADNVTSPVITPAGWNITDTTAIYKTENRVAGYTLSDDAKSINYTSPLASKNLVTVTGLKSGVSADDLTLSGKNVTVSANALGASKVSISSGYNLVLGSDVTKSQTIAAGWNISGNTATYKTKEITAGYVLASNKKSVTYNSASGGDVLTTVTGLKSGTVAKNIPINTKTKTVTLNKAALGTDTVSVTTGDYTLALGSDVKSKSKTTAAHFEISGTTAKYVSTKITAGYALATDKKSVSYISTTSGGDTLATITGLKKGVKANQISIDTENKVITLSKNALGTATVNVTGDYTLALADDVAGPITTEAKFVVSGTTAKYVSTQVSAGYTLPDDKKSITYSKATGGATLATISGLKSGVTADKFSISDNTITIAEGVGGTKGLTVSGKDYEFKIIPPYKVTVNGTAGAVYGGYIVDSGLRGETLIGGKGNDVLRASNGGPGVKYNYVSGGDGNDYLHGGIGYLSATLLGGNGNDTLDGNNGTDNVRIAPCTLTGGKGNDIFVYSGGYITVTDYTAGQDKIQCDSNSEISNLINQATVSGNDVYLNKSVNPYTNNFKGVESCYLLKNAKGKKITFIDNYGNETVKTFTANATSANVAELWFTADDANFSTSSAQIDSIAKSELSDCSLGNISDNTNLMTSPLADSLTSSLTFAEK